MTKRTRKGIIFIVSGPSGSGKTTLCKKILSRKSVKRRLVETISVTTRPKRRGERQDKDYQFISKKEFIKMKTRGQLLENEKVFGFFYGTPRSFVDNNLKRGKDVLLCIDVKGARSVKKVRPNACRIFIMPPSIEALRKRLKRRSTETKSHMLKRLKLAKWEIGFAKKYDYIVMNDKLGEAVDQLDAAMLTERARRN